MYLLKLQGVAWLQLELSLSLTVKPRAYLVTILKALGIGTIASNFEVQSLYEFAFEF